MQWMCGFQMRLDETKRLNCVTWHVVSSLILYLRTGGKCGLHLRELTTCVVFLCLNETRLPSSHFSITVTLLVRSKAEMFLWDGKLP